MTKNEAVQLRKLVEAQTDAMPDKQIINFPTYVEKWNGNGVSYAVCKRLNYNGVIYKVLTDHVSQPDWTPEASPSLFAKVLIPDENVIPEWEQPESTNAYMAGDKVTHNGKTWVSDVDNNVWEPGVYGWTEVV